MVRSLSALVATLTITLLPLGSFAATDTAVFPVCGKASAGPPGSPGGGNGDDGLTATDALIALNAAVGVSECDVCLCDIDGNGTIAASDALKILRIAVGAPLTRDCPVCACPLFGLAFSPYIDGQDPADDVTVTQTQVNERLALVAGTAERIRTYGSTRGLELIAPAAKSMGYETAVGAWLDSNETTNNQEIASLIAQANAGSVDVAIVGSESLLRSEQTLSQLINRIREVKAAVPSHVLVTTAEVYSTWLANPELGDEVDLVFAHIYPFWEEIPIDSALNRVRVVHQGLVSTFGEEMVVIGETGWPSGGNAFGASVPSPENAATYFFEFTAWARSEGVPYYYFSALDEDWKAAAEGERGRHWGIFDKSGVLKTDMDCVFLCASEPQ